LEPGSYTITAGNVPVGNVTYTASPVSQTLNLTPSTTPAVAAVTYAALGSLVVTITGLPAGVAASVQLQGPGGLSQTLTASTSLPSAAPGTYTLVVSPVRTGSDLYSASPATLTVVVVGTAGGSVTVPYLLFGLDLQTVVSGLTSPVYLTAPAGDPRSFVVQQDGMIRVIKNGQLLTTPYLDISSRVQYGGEQGLLSMAFDPNFASNGFFFVYFIDHTGTINIERYSASPSADVANSTPAPVLTIPHPTYSNHNGGLLMFGPDGMLYAGTGDGGGAGDPNGNAQNLGSMLGKLLRLDVRTLPYTPQGINGTAIWAYGLRNPWRYTFRPRPGQPGQADLYIADVGQGAWEEIDISPSNPSGINYGWNRLEGNACYPPGSSCSDAGTQRPVYVYDHSNGCSITGGFVYRGTAMPELNDDYFFSDYCGGWLSALHNDSASGFVAKRWTTPNIGSVLSFGQDAAGEVYMLAADGTVYRIVPKRG
jgi:hypothetical protein